MNFQVRFYRDRRGKRPVREFIFLLPKKTREKIWSWIDILSKEGPFLRRPYADKLSGKLYELRIKFASDSIRILYYFFLNDKIVMVHAFRKKDWEIEPKDIELAERRMNEIIQRHKQGEVAFE